MSDSERELELFAELGLLPKVGARFTTRWHSRGDKFLVQLEEDTGLDRGEIEQRCADNERLEDLLVRATQRAVTIGDAFYREALGRGLAAAFDPDVVVDEAELLVDHLITLDPTALRLLHWIFTKGWSTVQPPRLANHGWDGLGFSDVLISTGVASLRALNLLSEVWQKPNFPPQVRGAAADEIRRVVRPTEWGERAYKVCLEHLEYQQVDDEDRA